MENFPGRFFGVDDAAPRQRLGQVVGGSLSEGVQVKLDPGIIIEGITVGSYVTIDGNTGRRYFGLVTDIKLDATDVAVQKMPPSDPMMIDMLRGTTVFGLLEVKPHLVREQDTGELRPVKSVPAHFTAAYRSTPEEVREVFASDEGSPYRIGASLEDEKIEINIDLERMLERSSAIFGRSGTGKTFMTVPLLAAVIHKDLASCLIFDMHNDYGYTLKGDKNRKFKGLKQLNAISNKTVIVTLDEKSSRVRNSRPEFALAIGYGQIEPEDLESVSRVLALTDVQVNALYAMKRRAPKTWIYELINDDVDGEVKAMIAENKIIEGTYYAMQRKLQKLLGFEFIREQAQADFVERIIGYLTKGISVIVEFGKYGDDMGAYVFVANFLTRRIRERYRDMKEDAEGGGGVEPKKLVIVIEEAHKFLEPGVAEHTIFGTIARELRKYNVTLMVVDQRPSQIDGEVMSQIGTRITCALSDEKDISAVFTGINGAAQLRGVLASLDSKQQALIMGHAVPMPVAIHTTEYGEKIYEQYAIGPSSAPLRREKPDLKSEQPFA
ncbi:MAG: ATP-binding protein [Chloroflexi bacterium]|nr:ATP-binding protein [Chloroflexota bacterium]